MTAVVMARDYATAAEAARVCGLGQDWVYPHREEMLHGLIVPRVVYVEGWLESRVITTTTADLVQTRLAPDAAVVCIPRDFAGTSAYRPTAQAAVSAPFVDAVTPPGLFAYSRPPRRRLRLPAWVWILAVAVGGSGIGAAFTAYGKSVGWW